MRDIEISEEVKITTDSPGFKRIIEAMSDRISELELKLNSTIDPNEALACIREKNGVLYFMNIATELIRNGKNAEATLTQMQRQKA